MGLVQDQHKSCLEIQGDYNETLKVLNTQRHSRILCDVNLMVDGEEFPAHKGVLAANSNFFLAMFTTEMMEKDKARASVNSVSAGVMENLLEFMYTGQIQIRLDNVFELLEASNFLFVEKVKKACCQFLEGIVDMENCFKILSIADTFSCDDLSRTVTQYINRKFTELAKTEAFMKLGKEDLIKFLSSDDIEIENEEQLLEIIMIWINYDLEHRKGCMSELLRLIRLPFIRSSHIQVKIDQLNRRAWPASTEIRPRNHKNRKMTARKSYSSVEVLAVTGGCDGSAILNSGCCYIPAVSKWAPLSNMKVPRWRHQIVASKNNLFAIGGLRDVCVKDPVIPFVERFRGGTNSWDPVPHQPAVHDVEVDSFCAVSTGSSVLLVGGVDPQTNSCSSSVSSVQLTDDSSNVVQLSSLLFPRAGHCLVTSGDHAYAIGGFQTPHTHDSPDGNRSVECYDIAKDVWTRAQPMNEGRHSAAAVSLNGKIFIFGGCDGQNVLSSCEVYDTKLDRWQHISPMHDSRMRHSAVVHVGKVYIVGGVSANRAGPGSKSVECYVPEENRWTKVPDMPTGRFDHQCHVCNVGYKFIAQTMESSL